MQNHHQMDFYEGADKLAARLMKLRESTISQATQAVNEIINQESAVHNKEEDMKPEATAQRRTQRAGQLGKQESGYSRDVPERPIPGQIMKYAESEERTRTFENNSKSSQSTQRRNNAAGCRTTDSSTLGLSLIQGVYVNRDSLGNSQSYNAAQDEDNPVALEGKATENNPNGPHCNSPAPQTKTRSLKGKKSRSREYQIRRKQFDNSSEVEEEYLAPNLKSMRFDVYGRARRVAPCLPPCYTRESADIDLNGRYIGMEWDARKASRTASSCLIRNMGRDLKEFQLTPSHIHFGNVAAGATAQKRALLSNTSLERARFHVVRPSLPFSVSYRTGPLPAGMTTEIIIGIQSAVAGDFIGEVIVKTQLNVLKLTCSVKVEGELSHLVPNRQREGSAESIASSNATTEGHDLDAAD